MKRFTSTIALAALCSSGNPVVNAGQSTQTPQTNEIAGVWEMTVVTFGVENVCRLRLDLTGDRIVGHTGGMSVKGSFNDKTVEFQVRRPNGEVYGEFAGRLQHGEMAGEGRVAGGESKWTARRPSARPPGASHTHDFQPHNYYLAFSYAFPPALRIFPGDTVRTKTIDALGLDENLVRRGNEGNPLTGPFYVEGALPGDTLVVHFSRIRLNRDSAISGHKINPAVVAPDYISQIRSIENFDSHWNLDREHNVAKLANPTPALKDYVVPLHPTLGCIGVAPRDQQSWSAHLLGDFGGNLDYNQLREGTTVYLPVFHPGALLFFGDGHAAEGDGELAALETSFDVEFTVELVPDKSSKSPRAENDDFLMAMGIGGSLTDAMQLATSELMKWLESDYQLNSAELAIVLGTGIRYDIAEIVDPQQHVVAKISKSILAQLHVWESDKSK